MRTRGSTTEASPRRRGADKRLLELENSDSDVDEAPVSPNEAHSQEHPTSTVSTVFGISTLSLVLKVPTDDLTELIQIKGSAKQSKKKNKNEEELVYVYDFGLQQNLHNTDFDVPMVLELYRTGRSSYLNFRATSKMHVYDKVDLRLMGSIRNSNMFASILDVQGKIIQAGKFSREVEFDVRRFRFEIEDFVSLDDLAEILSQNGGISIRVAFECSRILTVVATFVDSESESLDEVPKTKLPFEFKHFSIYDRFNSQFGTRTLNDFFFDGTIRVKYENNPEVLIRIHRVLLAAQSPVLHKTLLEKEAVIVIEGFHEKVVRVFVDYMYCGEVYSEDVSLLTGVVKLAQKFEVLSLNENCIRNICKTLHGEQKSSKQLSLDYFRLGRQLRSPLFTQLALEQYKISKCERKIKNLRSRRGKATSKLNSLSRHPNAFTGEDLSYDEARILQTLEKLMCSPEHSEEHLGPGPCATFRRPSSCVYKGRSASAGYLHKLPIDAVKKLWELPLNSEFDENDEHSCMEFDLTVDTEDLKNRTRCLKLFKIKGSNDVNLRIVDTPADSGDSQDRDRYMDARCLFDGWVYDYESLGPMRRNDLMTKTTMKISVCYSSGRCVHEVFCKSFIRREDSCKIWEMLPFITSREFSKFQNRTEAQQELVLLTKDIYSPVSMLVSSTIPIGAVNYVNQITMDQYSCQIFDQLQNTTYSDAFIHVIDKNQKILSSFPVHKAIVSAFSELFESGFMRASEIHVHVEDFSTECISAMLHYVYGNHVPRMSLGLGLQLLTACRDFKMGPGFKEYIHRQLLGIMNWTFEFGLIFFKYGHFLKVTIMKEAAIKFFQQNKEDFYQIAEFRRFVETFPEIGERLLEQEESKVKLVEEVTYDKAVLSKVQECMSRNYNKKTCRRRK